MVGWYQDSNTTTQPHASAAATASRPWHSRTGTRFFFKSALTLSRSATATVKPTIDGSAGAVPPGMMSATRSGDTTMMRC